MIAGIHAFSHTQYRVGEYINFCLDELDDPLVACQVQLLSFRTTLASPILVRGSVFESRRAISVQLVSDLWFGCSAFSRSNSFKRKIAACIDEVMNILQITEFLSPSIISLPGRQFGIVRSLSSTFSLSEVERAERMLHSSFVSEALPASRLLIVGTERPVQVVVSSVDWLVARVLGDPVVALALESSCLS